MSRPPADDVTPADVAPADVQSPTDVSRPQDDAPAPDAPTSDAPGQDTRPPARPLALKVLTKEPGCADLAVAGRTGYAVRFEATGTPGAKVELWAEKSSCKDAPFRYREIVLDASGRGLWEISHPGSTVCTDAEVLLGGWKVWLVAGAKKTPKTSLVFSNKRCAQASTCARAASHCPPPPSTGPKIPANKLFVLSAAERAVFKPPSPGWADSGGGFESYPLKNLYEAFDKGKAVVPLDPDAGPKGWYELDGKGSQNHSLLWIGVSALGYALANDVAKFENAAKKARRLLELDKLQGHMRHEAIGGYSGFWEGGIATMALAGLYAPKGSTTGAALLADARRWWEQRQAILRELRMPDGQIALIGARIPGANGTNDRWQGISAAVNMQLLNPLPYASLHKDIKALLTATNTPAIGNSPVRWYRARHVAERWCVLRAIQSGAIAQAPLSAKRPKVVQDVYRWKDAKGRIHVAAPKVFGYRPARWHVSWTSGSLLRIEVGDADGITSGKGPHNPPSAIKIPNNAAKVIGPPN